MCDRTHLSNFNLEGSVIVEFLSAGEKILTCPHRIDHYPRPPTSWICRCNVLFENRVIQSYVAKIVRKSRVMQIPPVKRDLDLAGKSFAEQVRENPMDTFTNSRAADAPRSFQLHVSDA